MYLHRKSTFQNIPFASQDCLANIGFSSTPCFFFLFSIFFPGLDERRCPLPPHAPCWDLRIVNTTENLLPAKADIHHPLEVRCRGRHCRCVSGTLSRAGVKQHLQNVILPPWVPSLLRQPPVHRHPLHLTQTRTAISSRGGKNKRREVGGSSGI